MKKSIIAIMMALVMSLACLTGCGQSAAANNGTELASGGVLVLSVNPEIAVEYDENGLVTGVSARNDDAMDIISNCKGLIGKETREAVTALVSAIGEAGYFVEEIEGERRQITIEIEAGSKLPHDAFLDEVVSDVRDCVNENNWNVPMDVENESDYGITDYVDTDYGPNNDGVTDYDDTDYGTTSDGVTDYDDKPASTSGTSNNTNSNKNTGNSGNSNYGNTNYGNTNYGNTDYGSNSDGATNYDDGDSGYSSGQTTTTKPSTSKPSTSKPSTTTPSKPSNSGSAGNGDSGYDSGNSNYGSSDSGYDNSGDSGYDSGDSGYDSGDSGYDGGDSGYDD